MIDAALRGHFGQEPGRASVSYVGVEPVEVLRFELEPGQLVYASLGMARAPMTGADQAVQHADGPRAELLLRLHDPVGSFADAWRAVALLAAAPAVEGVVYGDGLTVDLGQPLGGRSRCTGGVVAGSDLPDIDTPAGPVAVLRLLPATAAELAWARVHGSAALRARWDEHAIDLLDLGRTAVPLG